MGTFNTKKELYGNPSLIPAIANNIVDDFQRDGYEVRCEELISGGRDISLTKGGMFKAVLGMKTALKVTLIPNGNSISFEAGIGIFGQQTIPTIIMLFFAWPVLLTQIWGLVQQADLDDRALRIAEATIGRGSSSSQTPPPVPSSGNNGKFCTNCGSQLPAGAKFCSNCGARLS